MDLEAFRHQVENMTGDERILAQEAAAQSWNLVMLKRILEGLVNAGPAGEKDREVVFVFDVPPGMYTTNIPSSVSLRTIKACFERANTAQFVGINGQLKKYLCTVTDVASGETNSSKPYYLLRTTAAAKTKD